MGIRRFVSSGPRWLRITAATALAAGVIAGTAAIAVRVLAPAEVSTTQAGPFPAASEQPGPGVRGVLTSAPLVVAGQLRIYAATRQVRADGPVDAKTERSPYWSYRRWPEQLVGVVVTGDTVVSRWSDGQLVGLDGLTGEVRWRTPGPEPIDSGYTGGRTGADIVYRPHGLHTANPPGGTPVLIAGNSTELRGFDAATGRELWQARYDRPNCRATGFTTTGGAFLTVDVCATEEPPVELYDVTTGAMTRWQPEEARKPLQVTGVSCAAAASDCPAVRILSAGARRGWSTAGPTPVPVPALDPPTALVAGDTVVAPGDDPTTVVATSLDGGAPRWSRDVDTTAPTGTPAPSGPAVAGLSVPPVRLLASQPGRLHLLVTGGQLVTLDPATGAELSRSVLTVGITNRQKTDWQPGHVYAEAGLVCIERLPHEGDPEGTDPGGFFVVQPMILAGT
ncbi:PQQ-binding-like beta-propeller repeat protein [Polymorphospora sp. NPDC051019]|uniref:outer membrane protein assembly factor BamB family protein n=1 Tax=Polymorphospora sp. NPDC051019 TaxID=3155725 RepID=UPI003428AB99